MAYAPGVPGVVRHQAVAAVGCTAVKARHPHGSTIVWTLVLTAFFAIVHVEWPNASGGLSSEELVLFPFVVLGLDVICDRVRLVAKTLLRRLCERLPGAETTPRGPVNPDIDGDILSRDRRYGPTSKENRG